MTTKNTKTNESIDPSEFMDEPISFNRRVSGKYKVKPVVKGKVVRGKSYGADYDAGADETKEQPKPEVKRGRGRPRKATQELPKKMEFPSSLMPKVLKPKDGYKAIKATRKVRMEEIELELNEVLSKDASAGEWIHDFVHSDNPRFKGKSKEERIKMALGAYYGRQNEELELNEVKSQYHPSHPYGLRHMEFMGKEKRLGQKETWHKSVKDREKYIAKLEDKGNYYDQLVVGMFDPHVNEQSMAAMGRHAEREWHDEMSSKSGAGNLAHRHHLVRNGQRISSHPSEKAALDAWSKHSNQKGIKIVHEDFDGTEYEYGIDTYQEGVMYKYEVTLDGEIIKEGKSVTLSGAQTMGIRKVLTMMEGFENIFEEPIETKQVLDIAKSIARGKE